jgi:hypothetical protein
MPIELASFKPFSQAQLSYPKQTWLRPQTNQRRESFQEHQRSPAYGQGDLRHNSRKTFEIELDFNKDCRYIIFRFSFVIE